MSPQAQAFVFFGCLAVAGLVIGIGIVAGFLRGGTWLAVASFASFLLSSWMLIRGYRMTRTK